MNYFQHEHFDLFELVQIVEIKLEFFFISFIPKPYAPIIAPDLIIEFFLIITFENIFAPFSITQFFLFLYYFQLYCFLKL